MSNYKPHPLAGSPLVDYVARALADLSGYSRWSDLDERGREVRVRNAARLLDGVGTWAAWHDHDDLKDALARLLDCDTTLWDDATRTPKQRSEDAVDELRRRLKEDA